MKRLLVGSVLSAGLKVGSAALSFLMFMFLARVLGPTEYGLFASMFALGTIGAIAALFGQHTLSIKILASLPDGPQSAADRRRTMWRGYQVTVAGATLFIGLLLVAGSVAGGFGFDLDMRYLVGASLLVLPFAFSELVQHQYRAFGAILWALAPREIIWRGAIVLACLGAAGLPFLFADALTVMAALSGALLVIVAVQLVALILGNRTQFTGASGDSATVAMSWRVSAWMWLASLGTMGASLNLSAAALFLSPAEVGAYFAAQKTSQLLQLPIIAINIAATPVFARLYSQRDTEGLREVGRKLSMLIAVPLLIGAGVIAGLAPQLLALFDPAFVTATLALVLLAFSYLLIGLGGPTRQLMLMADGERPVVRLTLISEIAGLALIPVLVPSFGILGAAIAACVARVIFTVMTVIWCRTHLGVDTSVLSVFRKAAAPQ
jgi:O-antigen/teichoic acid export membrane protein